MNQKIVDDKVSTIDFGDKINFNNHNLLLMVGWF
jgi:ASC-1-like (ASCH) protein